MFELFELPNFPTPFPSISRGMFKIDELMAIGFTIDEVLDALDGKVIRDYYIVDFAPSFLRKLQIDQLVNDYPDGLSEEEIAEALHVSHGNVRVVIHNAEKKLQQRGVLRKLLENIHELRMLRARREKWDITINGTLTLEIVRGV